MKLAEVVQKKLKEYKEEKVPRRRRERGHRGRKAADLDAGSFRVRDSGIGYE